MEATSLDVTSKNNIIMVVKKLNSKLRGLYKMVTQCRLCGQQKLKLYYTEGNNNEFKYYKCLNCKLVNYDISAGIDQEKHGKDFKNPKYETMQSNTQQSRSYEFIKKHFPLIDSENSGIEQPDYWDNTLEDLAEHKKLKKVISKAVEVRWRYFKKRVQRTKKTLKSLKK